MPLVDVTVSIRFCEEVESENEADKLWDRLRYDSNARPNALAQWLAQKIETGAEVGVEEISEIYPER